MRILAVDIGGSGVKVMIIDGKGKQLSERARVPTPQPATPQSVINSIKQLAAKQAKFDRVAVGFPGVVRKGVTETAHNLDKSWIGFPLEKELSQALGKPVRAANDADVQGLAVVGGRGVELVLTLGTGLGSALFVDGKLVPNLEVAHHPFRKSRTYEECLGAQALEKSGKKKWNRSLQRAFAELHHLFNYDRLWIGGGNGERVKLKLPPRVKIVPNVAGLLGGAALWKE
ncbi:MAG: ROK family protein [Acidimicrobiia bacterium]|nr:ROK family protein [Acidimicrobiia bacterium]